MKTLNEKFNLLKEKINNNEKITIIYWIIWYH